MLVTCSFVKSLVALMYHRLYQRVLYKFVPHLKKTQHPASSYYKVLKMIILRPPLFSFTHDNQSCITRYCLLVRGHCVSGRRSITRDYLSAPSHCLAPTGQRPLIKRDQYGLLKRRVPSSKIRSEKSYIM